MRRDLICICGELINAEKQIEFWYNDGDDGEFSTVYFKCDKCGIVIETGEWEEWEDKEKEGLKCLSNYLEDLKKER